MSDKLCQQAIETVLGVWATNRNPPLRVDWENTPFDLVTGQTYLRGFLLPATTYSADLAGSHREYHGLYQISVITPIDLGPGAGRAIQAELEQVFPLYSWLAVDSFRVQIIAPVTAGPAIQDADCFTIPVQFSYRADTI